MSAFRHAICMPCWRMRLLRPDNPSRSTGVVRSEMCCWCGSPTEDRIYVIQSDDRVPCRGVHRRVLESQRSTHVDP